MRIRMKPAANWVVALLLCTTMGLLAQGPGPGPGGFRGPMPGPGPMQSQSKLMLLEIPEVQTELAITETLHPQLDELTRQLHDDLRATFENGFRDFFDLTEEDRQARFEDLQKQNDVVTADSDKRLAKLLDAKQNSRLSQLWLQHQGLDAFGLDDVAKKLDLNKQQREEIREIQSSARPRFGFGPPDFQQMEEARQKAFNDAVAVLTDNQKTKWAEIIGKKFRFPQPEFGPGGPGRFGPRGPGGPMGGEQQKLVKEFDKNGDGWLNKEERSAARQSQSGRAGGGGFRRGGPGGPMGRGNRETPKPGPKVSPNEVDDHPGVPLYDTTVLRTVFLTFENDDWESELEAFHNTDVEVPATLTVDGKTYPNVGVHFRGMSSYGMVPTGSKRSLNVSVDAINEEQRLYGYKTLNLLNCNGDPSLMSTLLYSHIAREFLPAPKANFVKVVINGESWGVYANVQQFDKVFLKENFNSSKGTRWKVSGSPGGDGGLRYLGDNIDDYKRRYEMKSNDGEKAWKSLIELCKTLNETPLDELEAKLEPILDIDGVLRFLALDVALVNSDGYWTRASDYNLYRDVDGKFHVIPHDMNEAFALSRGPGGFGPPGNGPAGFGPPGFGPPPSGPPGPGGPDRDRPEAGRRSTKNEPQRDRREDRGPREGNPREFDPQRGPMGPGRGFGGPGGPPGDVGRRGPGGPGHGGVDLDPLVALNDAGKPLRSRLLAVPTLRAKYLDYVRAIAESSLNWENLGPIVAQQRKLIELEVEADTRKLDSFEAFNRATAPGNTNVAPGNVSSLRAFADQRRKFLLDYKEPNELLQTDK